MYRPSIKSRKTLIILALVSLLLYYVSEKSRLEVKNSHFEEKIEAANVMKDAFQVIRDHRAAKGVFDTKLSDPLVATLVGQKYSLITTEEGLLSSKLTSLNPNFAAVIVDMLKQAGVEKGDKIAVGASGSFPGLNLAVLSACKVLELEPVQITSLGSSSWGANEEDFTWLDMEKVLRDAEIFNFKTVAATCGGGNDAGLGLSPMGRNLLSEAATRNEIPLLEADDLQQNIAKRMEIYGNIKQYKAYINIGGGIASLGHPANADIIDPGFNHRLMQKNYPGIGVINHFGASVPIIQLSNIDRLRRMYDLPMAPNPLPHIGEGTVFVAERYDLRVTYASLVIIVLMLVVVFRLDKMVFKLSDEGTDPDSLV
ncbi:MAG: poly-gamma-glutamate system protein [FCB group bacterium]|nr:poly-gamma-glutamate system protein [FCB group bacterium]